MAVFLDLENIAIGARDARYPTFSIAKVFERLFLRGHIVLKKAYCDFSRFKEFKRDLHDAAFELIEIPHFRQSGKNSADIRMVVDARRTNALHRRPPAVHLGSVEAFSELDWSEVQKKIN